MIQRHRDRGARSRPARWLLPLLLLGGLSGTAVRAEEDLDPQRVAIEVYDAEWKPLPGAAVRVYHVRPVTAERVERLYDAGYQIPEEADAFAPPLSRVPSRLEDITDHRTDAQGRCTVRILLGRTAVVEVGATATSCTVTAWVGRGVERAPIVRLRTPRGRRVSGRLRLPDGTPVRGSSDRDGAFVLRNEDRRAGTLLARAGSALAAVQVDVDPTAGPLVVALRATHTISGRIDALPEAFTKRGGGVLLRLGNLSFLQHAGKGGAFTFERIPGGTYRVEVPLGRMQGRIEGPRTYTTGSGALELRYVER